MFSLSYTVPSEIKGVIRVSKPVCTLGLLTDLDGRKWDVRAIIGDVVRATPSESLHPYFTDTSGASFGFVSQSWEPYKIEVVNA